MPIQYNTSGGMGRGSYGLGMQSRTGKEATPTNNQVEKRGTAGKASASKPTPKKKATPPKKKSTPAKPKSGASGGRAMMPSTKSMF